MANKYADQSKSSAAKAFMYGRLHKKGALSCARKRSFDDEESAIRFLESRSFSGRPYKCHVCLKWHNASK